MRVVAQDFSQVVARAARDTSGTGQLMPAMIANGSSDVILTFTRAGWSNPAGIQRPAGQRVRYRFFDGSLVREHWLAVDPALNTEPRQRVLLTKVKAVEIRFLDPVSRQWRTDWQPGSTGQVPPNTISLILTRPLAIEFSDDVSFLYAGTRGRTARPHLLHYNTSLRVARRNANRRARTQQECALQIEATSILCVDACRIDRRQRDNRDPNSACEDNLPHD